MVVKCSFIYGGFALFFLLLCESAYAQTHLSGSISSENKPRYDPQFFDHQGDQKDYRWHKKVLRYWVSPLFSSWAKYYNNSITHFEEAVIFSITKENLKYEKWFKENCPNGVLFSDQFKQHFRSEGYCYTTKILLTEQLGIDGAFSQDNSWKKFYKYQNIIKNWSFKTRNQLFVKMKKNKLVNIGWSHILSDLLAEYSELTGLKFVAVPKEQADIFFNFKAFFQLNDSNLFETIGYSKTGDVLLYEKYVNGSDYANIFSAYDTSLEKLNFDEFEIPAGYTRIAHNNGRINKVSCMARYIDLNLGQDLVLNNMLQAGLDATKYKKNYHKYYLRERINGRQGHFPICIHHSYTKSFQDHYYTTLPPVLKKSIFKDLSHWKPCYNHKIKYPQMRRHDGWPCFLTEYGMRWKEIVRSCLITALGVPLGRRYKETPKTKCVTRGKNKIKNMLCSLNNPLKKTKFRGRSNGYFTGINAFQTPLFMTNLHQHKVSLAKKYLGHSAPPNIPFYTKSFWQQRRHFSAPHCVGEKGEFMKVVVK